MAIEALQDAVAPAVEADLVDEPTQGERMTLALAILIGYAAVGILCYHAGADKQQRADFDRETAQALALVAEAWVTSPSPLRLMTGPALVLAGSLASVFIGALVLDWYENRRDWAKWSDDHHKHDELQPSTAANPTRWWSWSTSWHVYWRCWLRLSCWWCCGERGHVRGSRYPRPPGVEDAVGHRVEREGEAVA